MRPVAPEFSALIAPVLGESEDSRFGRATGRITAIDSPNIRGHQSSRDTPNMTNWKATRANKAHQRNVLQVRGQLCRISHGLFAGWRRLRLHRMGQLLSTAWEGGRQDSRVRWILDRNRRQLYPVATDCLPFRTPRLARGPTRAWG
jgi:hypothetical protein